MSDSLWPHWTGFPVKCQLPELAQTHVHQVSDAIQPSHPLSSPSPLLSIFPNMTVFSNDLVLHMRWPKCPSFSFPENIQSLQSIFRTDFLQDWMVWSYSPRDGQECPLADEWIRKLLYIYTMEYYSANKKNAFESLLMRWMKMKPIIHSEVSQKEKHEYSILMHLYGI